MNHDLTGSEFLKPLRCTCMIKMHMGKDQQFQHLSLQAKSLQALYNSRFRSLVATVHQDGLARPVNQVSCHIAQTQALEGIRFSAHYFTGKSMTFFPSR